MDWPIIAGVAQLTLIGLILATRVRAGRRPVGETLVYVVPMAALAVGTLAGASWAVVVAAVFYSVWLVNHLLSWRRLPWPDRRPNSRPARAPTPVRLAVGLVSLAVVALSWAAVAAAPVHPVA